MVLLQGMDIPESLSRVRGHSVKCEHEMFQATLYCSTEPTESGCYLAQGLPSNFGFQGIFPPLFPRCV